MAKSSDVARQLSGSKPSKSKYFLFFFNSLRLRYVAEDCSCRCSRDEVVSTMCVLLQLTHCILSVAAAYTTVKCMGSPTYKSSVRAVRDVMAYGEPAVQRWQSITPSVRWWSYYSFVCIICTDSRPHRGPHCTVQCADFAAKEALSVVLPTSALHTIQALFSTICMQIHTNQNLCSIHQPHRIVNSLV